MRLNKDKTSAVRSLIYDAGGTKVICSPWPRQAILRLTPPPSRELRIACPADKISRPWHKRARSLGQRERRSFENNEEREWVGRIFKRFYVRQAKMACGRSRDVVEETGEMSGSVTITIIVARESCSRVAVDPENAADPVQEFGSEERRHLCPRQAFVCLH